MSRDPLCICCRQSLQALELGNVIAPFWNELPRIFRIPLKIDSLMLIAGLSLLWGLAGAMAPGGLILLLLASGAYALHGTRLLHRIAHGYLEAPLQPLQDRPGLLNVLKQGLLFIILFGGAGFAAALLHSPRTAVLLLVLAVLLLPAAYITLVTSDRLIEALNPAFLIGAAFRIGWPYLLLWVLLLLISGGSGELQKLLHSHASLPVVLAVQGFFSMYFGLSTMALMGYVAYQHYDTFGQPVRDPALQGADGQTLRRLDPPDRAQLLLARGKIEEAQGEIEQRLRREPEQLELHALYQRLLAAKRDSAAAAAHADLFIGKLIDGRRDEQAWRVYSEFVAKFGKLEVKDGRDIVRLAAQARQNKQGRLGLPLLDKFAQRFSNSPDIPQAWLLTAQILTEELREDDRSRLILAALIKRYPDHPARAQAERHLALLSRLAGTSARTAPAG